jgi:hypothetical protein
MKQSYIGDHLLAYLIFAAVLVFLTDKNQRDPVSDQANWKSLLCRVSKG